MPDIRDAPDYYDVSKLQTTIIPPKPGPAYVYGTNRQIELAKANGIDVVECAKQHAQWKADNFMKIDRKNYGCFK